MKGTVAIGGAERSTGPSRRQTPFSVNDFVQRIFYDSLSTERLELRDDLPHYRFIDDRLHCDPVGIRQVSDRWISQCGKCF